MSNKLSYIFICTLLLFVVQSVSIAQTDTVKVKDSTAVQTPTTTTGVTGVTIPAGTN